MRSREETVPYAGPDANAAPEDSPLSPFPPTPTPTQSAPDAASLARRGDPKATSPTPGVAIPFVTHPFEAEDRKSGRSGESRSAPISNALPGAAPARRPSEPLGHIPGEGPLGSTPKGSLPEEAKGEGLRRVADAPPSAGPEPAALDPDRPLKTPMGRTETPQTRASLPEDAQLLSERFPALDGSFRRDALSPAPLKVGSEGRPQGAEDPQAIAAHVAEPNLREAQAPGGPGREPARRPPVPGEASPQFLDAGPVDAAPDATRSPRVGSPSPKPRGEADSRDLLSRIESVSVATVRITPGSAPSPFSRRLIPEDDAPLANPRPEKGPPATRQADGADRGVMDVLGEIFQHNAEVMRTARVPRREAPFDRREAAPPQEVTLNIGSIDLPPLDVPAPPPPERPRAHRPTPLAEYLRSRNEGRR